MSAGFDPSRIPAMNGAMPVIINQVVPGPVLGYNPLVAPHETGAARIVKYKSDPCDLKQAIAWDCCYDIQMDWPGGFIIYRIDLKNLRRFNFGNVKSVYMCASAGGTGGGPALYSEATGQILTLSSTYEGGQVISPFVLPEDDAVQILLSDGTNQQSSSINTSLILYNFDVQAFTNTIGITGGF